MLVNQCGHMQMCEIAMNDSNFVVICIVVIHMMIMFILAKILMLYVSC